MPDPTGAWSPDQLLREFLKATADPANRHLAARQFLTDSASKDWDDAGSALCCRQGGVHRNPFCGKDFGDHAGDILGSLSDIGVFRTGDGTLPIPGPSNWCRPQRLADQPAAQQVFLDWQQFQAAYKALRLYFVDPTGKTVVPDPRYRRCRIRTCSPPNW